MPFTVRLARPEDAPALHALNAAFNGDTGVTPARILNSLLTARETVVIAERSGEAVGFCCAQVHHSFCYPAPVAEVTEMYVCPSHRAQGCAYAMLALLEAHLQRTHGVDEMHLLTGTGNHSAQAAYRKAGYIPRNEQYMKKELR